MSTDTPASKQRTPEEWRTILASITERGLSTSAAAAELGVSTQAIQYWRKKLNSPASPPKARPGFRELALPKVSQIECEISCGARTRIVCRGLSVGDLVAVVRSLGGNSVC
jgi:transposase-like protein